MLHFLPWYHFIASLVASAGLLSRDGRMFSFKRLRLKLPGNTCPSSEIAVAGPMVFPFSLLLSIKRSGRSVASARVRRSILLEDSQYRGAESFRWRAKKSARPLVSFRFTVVSSAREICSVARLGSIARHLLWSVVSTASWHDSSGQRASSDRWCRNKEKSETVLEGGILLLVATILPP